MTAEQAKEAINGVSVTPLIPSNHIFTHIEWQMIGYEITLQEEAVGYDWLPAEEILREKAIPSAYQTYINYLKENCF